MTTNDIVQLSIHTLQDLKATDITTLEVAHLTEIAEKLIICTATSTRHVNALADKLTVAAKSAGLKPLGREGEKGSDWTLVDLDSVIVHIMTEQARKFYDLEGLWASPTAQKALA